MDQLREKIKQVIQEKIDIETKFKYLQKSELTRLNDLERKFEEISNQYIRCKEELNEVRKSEIALKGELQRVQQGRETFKE